MANKLLLGHAQRLGVHDETTIKKANEFLRILGSKTLTINISDIAKTVLCLDLASNLEGIGFDKETALKLTGLRKTVYQNNYNNVEKILELDKQLTVSELCVRLSCTVVKELAEKILVEYKNTNRNKDLSHPQYVVAAVYAACSLKNVKMEKAKFLAASRLKPAEWKTLVTEFNDYTKTLGLTLEKGKMSRKIEEKCDGSEGAETNDKPTKKLEDLENQVEEYEVWKERIIAEATEEILKSQLT